MKKKILATAPVTSISCVQINQEEKQSPETLKTEFSKKQWGNKRQRWENWENKECEVWVRYKQEGEVDV